MVDIDPGMLVPNFAGVNINISDLLPKLIWFMLVAVTFWVLWTLARHRISVETLEYVKGGYVSRSGRYARRYDKENNLEYLSPAFGGKRLPGFPSECFQKTKGIPFFGLQRILSLIKQNEYSYKVNLPAAGYGLFGDVRYYDTLAWTYIDEKRKFLKQLQRDRFLNILAIVAPVSIIVVMIGLLLFGIYVQSSLMQHEAAELTKTLEAVRQSYAS